MRVSYLDFVYKLPQAQRTCNKAETYPLRILFLILLYSLCLSATIAQALVPPAPRANPNSPFPELDAQEIQQRGLAPEATANLQKKFTLEGFFAGETIGKGTIFSKLIGASRSFNVSTVGTWDGTVLTLVENYQYAAGDQEQRIWKFTKTGEGIYSVESKEIEENITVEIEGRVARFKYQKKLPRPGKSPMKITFSEEWVLHQNGVLASKTRLSRLLRVGREAINFVRLGNEEALKAPGF